MNESEGGAPSGVNIRGIEGDFNSFTIDGNRVATRGFSTRNIVADGIANIEAIPDPAGTLRYARRENARGATNKGIELIANQKLFFLPGPLKGLSVSTSATFT